MDLTALPYLHRLPALIPRQVLFGNPERASPAISPDGQRLAYLAPDDGVLNVWVGEPGAGTFRPVTRDRGRGIRFFVWQKDSRHILYIQDRDGDENWRVYQTGLSTGTTRDLTPYEGIQARFVAVPHEHPDNALIALNHRDPHLHDVYRADLATGQLELDTPNPGDVSDWTADHALRVRAAHVTLPDGGTEIRVRDEVTDAWRTFLHWGPDESFGGVVGFTPDNKGLILIMSANANAARLVQADLGTGAITVLAEDPEYDVDGVLEHPRTHSVQAAQFVRARREWKILDAQAQADFEAIGMAHDGDFSVLSRDLEDRTWIIAYVVDHGPVYYYRYDRERRSAEMLFTSHPALEQYELARMEPFSFNARDGRTIHGYLTLPPGVAPERLATVLHVHGGPWARDTWGLNPTAQWLANRGYAVLEINYRGSTGYGKDHLNAGDREWAGKMHDDLIDGKRWSVENGYTDPGRVAIMGGSYGGYAALVGLAFTPDEFTCGVDIVGPSSIATLVRSIPPYWLPMKGVFDKRVGKLETEEEFLNSRSPLFKAHEIRAPLLIAQGANDPRVKQAESDQIVAAMRKNGQPVEYLVFPDEGHGFARPENRQKFHAAAEAFLARYLGGRAEPPAEAEESGDLRR